MTHEYSSIMWKNYTKMWKINELLDTIIKYIGTIKINQNNYGAVIKFPQLWESKNKWKTVMTQGIFKPIFDKKYL